MIEIKNLSKSFDNKVVLNNFSAQINDGDIVCVMGQSGKGKTTLLNILMGFEKPDRGEITGLLNNDISVVFQEDRLCENLTAVKNIAIINPKLEKEKIIHNLLETKLSLDSLNLPLTKLSGGMKRRVAIVRAVLANSNIVIMDEPFKGLDMETKTLCINYVLNNLNQRTAIIVTHIEEEAELLNAKIIKI